MNTRILSLAALMALSAGGAALAQASAGPGVTHPAASSAVGHWLYDLQGNKVGSVRNLTGDGHTAVIMVGSYFQPGSHQATVPTSALSVVNGKVTLRNETVQALNIVTPR